jgi:hypothetical protein
MKKSLFLFWLLVITYSTFAQLDKSEEVEKVLKRKVEAKNEGWNKGGLINIGFTQGMLENWAAGGERLSMAINGQFNGFLAHVKGNKIWENTADLYYGLNYVQSNNFVPRKLDDRLDLSSRYGVQPENWTLSKNKLKRSTYLTGLFRFQSQFTEGYNYELPNWQLNPISEFFSPAYFTLALGADIRPSENFTIFFSPLAAKITAVKARYTEFGSAFGVPMGKTSRFELGAYLSSRFKTNLTKNILYTTRLDLYSNYLAKNTLLDGNIIRRDNPGNIDILWDNFFAIKISKFIGAGFGFTTIYDNDVPGQKYRKKTDEFGNVVMDYGPFGWTQLKQVLNVGFSYKF